MDNTSPKDSQHKLPWVKEEKRHDREETTDVKRFSATEPTAICNRCRHYQRDSRCEAYTKKIPTEILLGYVFHIQPYKDDQGIRFEPIDLEEDKHGDKKFRG